MNLRTIQQKMAAAVMQPLTPSDSMRPKTAKGKSMRKEAAEFIKPNDRLTSFERLELYNRQYWFRILGGLAEDFPGLQTVIGERKFDAMSRGYLTECPSESFTLRNLGKRLEAWLRKNPKWIAPQKALALDVVRLEWAQIDVFDAAEMPRMRTEDLPALGPDPRLRLQPYLRLLELSYPVDNFLISLNHDQEISVASNAMTEKRHRTRVRKPARLQPEKVFLVVHRVELSVYLKRIDAEAFALLQALQKGKTFMRACLLAFRGSVIPEDERPEMVQKWFENWSALGWFARPEPANKAATRKS